jgi:hypothetical protein
MRFKLPDMASPNDGLTQTGSPQILRLAARADKAPCFPPPTRLIRQKIARDRHAGEDKPFTRNFGRAAGLRSIWSKE